MTWTCTDRAYHKEGDPMNVTSDKPAGLSEEERAALDECKKEVLASYNASRVVIGLAPVPWEYFGCTPNVEKASKAFFLRARAPLEAELKMLRERLSRATAMNRRQAEHIGDLEGYLGKDGTAFLHTGTPATVEAVRRIAELKAQLAQAQKPAADHEAEKADRHRWLMMAQKILGGSFVDLAALSTWEVSCQVLEKFAELKQKPAAPINRERAIRAVEVLVKKWRGWPDWPDEWAAELVGAVVGPAAPAGLPEVDEEIEVWNCVGRMGLENAVRDVVKEHLSKNVFRAKRNGQTYSVELEGLTWRRLPTAQTSREPPTPTPGEVSTENLHKVPLVAFSNARGKETVLEAGRADIRAAVERATAQDKARIAELSGERDAIRRDAAKLASDLGEIDKRRARAEAEAGDFCARYNGMTGVASSLRRERDAALAEVERLRGELAKLAQTNRALHEEYADSVGLGPAASLDEVRAARKASKRCPADGMDDETLGEAIINANVSTVATVSPLRRVGRKARELFMPATPAKDERKVQGSWRCSECGTYGDRCNSAPDGLNRCDKLDGHLGLHRCDRVVWSDTDAKKIAARHARDVSDPSAKGAE